MPRKTETNGNGFRVDKTDEEKNAKKQGASVQDQFAYIIYLLENIFDKVSKL